ncbi:MAG TPA: phosphoglycerate dehydrogenase [Spirochaetota bacterium]|nr:phosphoglycerate dehydrogenase [Spirochaetota bacterium]HPI89769.1 phosphoglycerate dehydrogenase [Spirochaetota bacterium]HPR47598.1 phosphoglycerate dehydrogenase [Spirochaetota bacterium]
MYKIQKLNKISPKGLELFPSDQYEYATEIVNPDAILVRSAAMHDLDLPESLKAVARAGAGVNNIPIEKCAEKGIVVFNTPGANANGVKELVLMGLLMASRKVYDGITWAKGLKGKGDEVPKLIEKGKSDFEGPEIKGKKLGVIGLGAIGVMVANDAQALGMEVAGFDPFISVDAAWGLSRSVKKSISLDSLLADSDYVTLHVPLNDATRGLINKDKFNIMKKGTRLLNFARGGLVNNDDLKAAIDQGIISCYVTDFPDEELLSIDRVIPIPHLGASTPESEDNCAIMAVNQIKAYLEMGNIVNSVNYPDCMLPLTGKMRIIIANKNVPNMIGQITQVLADHNINIADMLNKSKGDYAYNIIDIDGNADDALVNKLKSIKDIIMVRLLAKK